MREIQTTEKTEQLTFSDPTEIKDECFVFHCIMNCVNATKTTYTINLNQYAFHLFVEGGDTQLLESSLQTPVRCLSSAEIEAQTFAGWLALDTGEE